MNAMLKVAKRFVLILLSFIAVTVVLRVLPLYILYLSGTEAQCLLPTWGNVIISVLLLIGGASFTTSIFYMMEL